MGETRYPAPQVIPYLLYEDAGAAMDWLASTFGFVIRERSARSDGSVRHGQLDLDGGGVIMVGSPGQGYRSPGKHGGVTQLVRVSVTSVHEHRDRARLAGAEASAVETGPPGWVSYTVTDPEGHQWYFTEQVDPPS